MPFDADPEQPILNALAYLSRPRRCDEGAWLVIINVLAHKRVRVTIQLRQID
jgi:hypothetical protein